MGKNSRLRRERRASRPVELPAELATLLDEQRVAFRAQFGRDPGPDDLLIFDPDAPEPRPLSAEAVERAAGDAAVAAGIRPEFAYAIQKTGMLVSEENHHLFSADDLAEWQAALEEGRRLAARRMKD